MTTSKVNINERDVIAYKCLKSLGFSTRYFFKEKQGRKFIMNWHHQAIINKLEEVIQGKCKRLIINMPPRYGKTEVAVKQFIGHCLALNPKSKFIHLSYSDTLALDNSEEAKDLVTSAEYQELFPHVKIKKDSNSKQKWYTTQGGGVYATATGGQVTGFGAGRVDEEDEEFKEWISEIESKQTFGGAIIIDDPIKPDDAHSETLRSRVNNKFDSTIRSRVNSRNTPIIVIMQRVHTEDLSGYLIDIEPNEWEVLSLPAIYKNANNEECALWPHKHTLEELEKLKKANEDVFNKQYLQDPQDLKGMLFPKDELRYFNPSNKIEFQSSLAYSDIADEGADFTSAPCGRNIGSDVYIPDVVFDDRIDTYTIPLTIDMIKRNDCKYIRIESNNAGAMYSRNLKKEYKGICQILTAHSSDNKHTRIMMQAGFIKQHFIFVHPDYQTPMYKAWFNQLTKYKKDGTEKKDDAADSCHGLAHFIQSLLPHLYK